MEGNPALSTFSDGSQIPQDGKYHRDPLNPNISIRVSEFWMPDGVTKFFSGGGTASIGLYRDGLVYKYLHNKDDARQRKGLEIEHEILSFLGPHKRIVKYEGRAEYGLLLGHAENGDLRSYVAKVKPQGVPPSLRIQWVKEAAEAIAFIHSHGVIHCDICPSNFLVDNELNLLLCDFAGSLFGELDGGALESVRYCQPREPTSTPNTRTDMFALGSLLYFILAGHEPFEDFSDDEVEALFKKGEYPACDAFEYGELVSGCWRGRFENVETIVHLIEKNGFSQAQSCA